ncbi:MAG: hypothetical protein CMG00_06745 [Candidatus Marinimicrobia bacterium]|nr:hypothetical protein [Candidatus Neomarinimicrobiota bacterium]
MRVDIKDSGLINKVLSRLLKNNINYNFRGISIDSKKIKKKDIFIALQGTKSHGADFLDDMLLNKLSLVISDKPIDNKKVFLVKDSKVFLHEFAKNFRISLNSKFICITGTNGKTSTKNLLVDFLKSKYSIDFSRGNFNSTTSLPLSILSFDNKSDYSVLEMGASKSSEIEVLSMISSPNIGLVTNISNGHLEGFKSFDDLVNTKMALYEFLAENNGIYFLNKDDSSIGRYSDFNSIRNVISFSATNQDSNYFASLSDLNKGFIGIGDYIFKVPYKTKAFVYNFLSSYSIASYLGVSDDMIQQSLNNFKLPSGRGDILKVGDIVIINDSYNANLESMKYGISSISSDDYNNKKVVLVLGDMLELGEYSVKIHKDLGQYISSLNYVDTVYGVGCLIEETINSINNSKINKKYFSSKESLIESLKNHERYKVYYFKGSRGMRIDDIINGVFGNVI